MNYFLQIRAHQSNQIIIAWPQWPPSNERLNQNILIHCSSQDIFVHEQNSLSKWLDLFTIEQRKEILKHDIRFLIYKKNN